MTITLIAAMDCNRLIGCDDQLPWHIPEDLQHFKMTTKGHPVVMGRKTYDGLPVRPLPGRTNIVLTRNPPSEQNENKNATKFLTDISDALDYGRSLSDEVFVIGGERIYEQTIGLADRLLISHVRGEFVGNRFFPIIDSSVWGTGKMLSNHEKCMVLEYCRAV